MPGLSSGDGTSPTKKISRVRSSTPAPDYFAPLPEGIQASLLKSDSRWSESSQAFPAEVVPWKDEGLWKALLRWFDSNRTHQVSEL